MLKKKRLISNLIAICLVLACLIPGLTVGAATETDAKEDKIGKLYHRAINVAGNASSSDATPSVPIPNDAPDITATSAVVMDIDTGEVLYEKNAFQKTYPASTTKILTALLAIENLSLSDKVTIKGSDNDLVPQSYVTIYLQSGEELTVENLLYALMLYSSNEVAFALGRTVSGDYDTFASLMNKTADKLGCVNSHFVTPNGIFNENHYSCAYDMALIGCDAYKNSTYKKITSTFSYTIPPTNLNKNERQFFTRNHMISKESKFYYANATGGKTGYTDDGNGAIVAYAERDGRRLCASVMNCSPDDNKFFDAATLFDFCFNNYISYKPLQNFKLSDAAANSDSSIMSTYSSVSNIKFKDYSIDRNFSVNIRNYVDVSKFRQKINFSKSDKENVLGTVVVTYEDHIVGEAEIYSSLSTKTDAVYINATPGDSVPKRKGADPLRFFKKIGDTFASHKLLFITPILLVIGGYFYKKYMDVKKERERKKRNKGVFKKDD